MGRIPRTVHEMLEATTVARPDGECAVFPDGRAGWRELVDLSRLAAARLTGLGVRPQDPVGILVPGNVEHLAILIGAMRIGAVPVPISSRFKSTELDYVVRHSRMVALLADVSCTPLLEQTVIETADVVLIDEPDRWEHAGDAVQPERLDALSAAVRPEDSALILYTSGTTSSPKGAVHTHASLVAEGRNVAERLELGPGDRFWTPLPMYHSAGS